MGTGVGGQEVESGGLSSPPSGQVALHRIIHTAPLFYGAYAGQIVFACLVVALGSNALLGTATQYVQVLAGILLPSASLFRVLLCNDTEIVGPWINGRVLDVFAVIIVAVLIVLSSDLTIATLFPRVNGVSLTDVCFPGAAALALPTAGAVAWARRRQIARGEAIDPRAAVAHLERATWRMKPLDQLARPHQTLTTHLPASETLIFVGRAAIAFVVGGLIRRRAPMALTDGRAAHQCVGGTRSGPVRDARLLPRRQPLGQSDRRRRSRRRRGVAGLAPCALRWARVTSLPKLRNLFAQVTGRIECGPMGRRVVLGDRRARYELAGGHHEHLVCDGCGAVEPFPRALLDALVQDVWNRCEFTVSGHRLVLTGTCGTCGSRTEPSAGGSRPGWAGAEEPARAQPTQAAAAGDRPRGAA